MSDITDTGANEDLVIASRANARIVERNVLKALAAFDKARSNVEEACRGLMDVDKLDEQPLKEVALATADLNNSMAQLHAMHHVTKRAIEQGDSEVTKADVADLLEQLGLRGMTIDLDPGHPEA